MANLLGPLTSFLDTTSLKIDLSDMVAMVTTPSDIPLWNALQGADPVLPAAKHEWLEDTLPASSDTLGAMYTSGGVTFTATDYTVYKKGYVLKIESELMRVTATPANTTVSVAGAYAGSSAANHANGVTVDIVGYAVTDGADPEPFATTDRTNKFNYHQMFQEKIEVTDFNAWTRNYGVKDKWTYEVEKWLKVIAIRREKSIIHGRRNSDSANSTRTLGGLLYYIATNVTAVGGALTETNLNDSIELAYKQGGSPDLILVSSKQKRKLSGLIAASQRYYVRPGADEAAGIAVNRYISDFGELDILLDRNIPNDVLFVLDRSTIRKINGQPPSLEELARTGSSRKGQIVGWDSFEFKAEMRQAVMTGLT